MEICTCGRQKTPKAWDSQKFVCPPCDEASAQYAARIKAEETKQRESAVTRREEIISQLAQQGAADATPAVLEIWNRMGTLGRAHWWSLYWQKNQQGRDVRGTWFSRRMVCPPSSPPPMAASFPGRYYYLTEAEAEKTLFPRDSYAVF